MPNGCKAIYQSTAAWNLFANIVEFDPETLGVDAVKGNDEAAESAFYTLDGKQLQQKRRGLQIVRMSDGTVRKVSVK